MPPSPLVVMTSNEPLSSADEESLLIHFYGSVDAGRAAYYENIRLAQSGDVQVIGNLPSPNELTTILPLNDDISVRIWGKGMEDRGLFSFDFVDNLSNPVNGPTGIKVYVLPSTTEPSLNEHLVELQTFEKGLGATCSTNEKYIVAEGTRLRLVRLDGQGRIVLQRTLVIPVRPRAGVPAIMY